MAAKDIIVWLIEWPEDDSNPVRWWRGGPGNVGGWKRDAYKATWFTRKEDAQDFKTCEDLYGVVTEHKFLD